MKQRARLNVDVLGNFVKFYRGTYGWVKVEAGVFWFSDTESFNKEVMVNWGEFHYV